MTEEEIWQAGFEAGETLQGQLCPYPAGSREAWIWQRGWVEGASKRMGYTYRDKPSGSDQPQ